jgi:ubiquinone/menaquinone biosynthesis C-methylase UbiE
MCAYYPDSRVELSGFTAKHYDTLLNIGSLGKYSSMIDKAIRLIGIKPADRVLDLGAGTGRNACLMAEYVSREGEITGLEISDEMVSQFNKKCADFPNVRIVDTRIDRDLDYEEYFDEVFISFVLHGFPQDARNRIIGNACRALKKGGVFCILDYNEFSINEAPLYVRGPFRLIECPYAFDFIERDFKKILKSRGFSDFSEHLFFRGYVRLLKGVKTTRDCPAPTGDPAG